VPLLSGFRKNQPFPKARLGVTSQNRDALTPLFGKQERDTPLPTPPSGPLAQTSRVAAKHGGDTFPGGAEKTHARHTAVGDCGTVEDYEQERRNGQSHSAEKGSQPTSKLPTARLSSTSLAAVSMVTMLGDWFEAERQLRTELQPKNRVFKRT
jgi:hypothetical protein